MFRYYDAHTHNQAAAEAGCTAICNILKDFDSLPANRLCSVGIHPWYAADHELIFPALSAAALQHNVVAIGECGLDKACNTPWAIQQTAFRQQVLLANKLSKPLMIHCVRAFNELETALKEHSNKVPVIIHGFSKKPAVAATLLANVYYLSFGAALLRNGSAAALSLVQTPLERILLETDNSDISIKDIYRTAAHLLKTSEELLILQIGKNFNTVFNKS